ncbi:sigma-70 family RNA polymerase sigma factor [Arcicella aquatica]|uniref:Sigma-70 family RNA polymerase sigma factor n=1 Tax=Arcicella aquatica TaxID=217141 RepID=A0ABU5QL22_9BACT|nr:sigma-70 family RNA polymerase sigma factor [Arcicella aquatica]MEA5257485.1 sigma-70 family RNA polymerase sigma factor [Arcicella aquatica]
MKLSNLNPENYIDQFVWLRFLEGEKSAFEELMKANFSSLFHYGSKFSKDKEFIKDCIQDLFLQLWERREHLSNEIVVKPYLMASLRRRIHRASLQLRFSDPYTEANDIFDIEFSIEEKFIQDETSLVLAQRIKQVIETLPKRQKEVIYLKFFQELERDQIAQIMDIAPQTASNLLQMAIKQLKKYWTTEFIALFLPLLLR